MRILSEQAVERIKERYPVGTRIELICMNDPYHAMKPGEKGTVDYVDCMGTVFVDWDNGDSIGVIYGEDRFRKIKED